MTGYRSSNLRHKCEARGCFIQMLPNWDEYIAAFPRKIRPTDVDGMVEINDHFLFMEEKTQNKPLDEGQRKALVWLSTRDRVTVVFFRPGVDSELEVLVIANGEGTGWLPKTKVWFTDWLHDWAYQADRAASSIPRPESCAPHELSSTLPGAG